MTQRNGLAPLPGTPVGLPAASGIGLTARFAAGNIDPQPTFGAVTLPYVQPELNGTVRVGRFSFSARASFVSAVFPTHDPANGAPPLFKNQVAGETVLGVGYEFTIGKYFGFVAAGDIGAIFASVAVRDSSGVIRSTPELSAVPSLSLGTGPFVNWGPLRVYAGLVLGTIYGTEWRTNSLTNCTLAPCTMEMGMLLAGGGVRLRISSVVSVGGELWTGWMEGNTIPINASLTLRLGDFDIALPKKERPRKKKRHEVSGPPPPEWQPPPELPPAPNESTTPPPPPTF
ncbi:MAG: hypothetical protein QM817_34885 [Archangium sp.]